MNNRKINSLLRLFFGLLFTGVIFHVTAGETAHRNTGITTANLKNHIEHLSAFGTRNFSHPHNVMAGLYIKEKLMEYGYDASFDYFEAGELTSMNVMANHADTKKDFILLGAHFDSTARNPKEAPGADDNASGVALLLEVARLIKADHPDLNIEFAFFNLEEVGKYGSIYLAQKYKSENAKLLYMINVDTIGTWSGPVSSDNPVNYVANEKSLHVIEELQQNLGLPLQKADELWRDDHASFWDNGFAAIELTEHGVTPHMHRGSDTAEKIHYENLAVITEALYRFIVNAGYVR